MLQIEDALRRLLETLCEPPALDNSDDSSDEGENVIPPQTPIDEEVTDVNALRSSIELFLSKLDAPKPTDLAETEDSIARQFDRLRKVRHSCGASLGPSSYPLGAATFTRGYASAIPSPPLDPDPIRSGASAINAAPTETCVSEVMRNNAGRDFSRGPICADHVNLPLLPPPLVGGTITPLEERDSFHPQRHLRLPGRSLVAPLVPARITPTTRDTRSPLPQSSPAAPNFGDERISYTSPPEAPPESLAYVDLGSSTVDFSDSVRHGVAASDNEKSHAPPQALSVIAEVESEETSPGIDRHLRASMASALELIVDSDVQSEPDTQSELNEPHRPDPDVNIESPKPKARSAKSKAKSKAKAKAQSKTSRRKLSTGSIASAAALRPPGAITAIQESVADAQGEVQMAVASSDSSAKDAENLEPKQRRVETRVSVQGEAMLKKLHDSNMPPDQPGDGCSMTGAAEEPNDYMHTEPAASRPPSKDGRSLLPMSESADDWLTPRPSDPLIEVHDLTASIEPTAAAKAKSKALAKKKTRGSNSRRSSQDKTRATGRRHSAASRGSESGKVPPPPRAELEADHMAVECMGESKETAPPGDASEKVRKSFGVQVAVVPKRKAAGGGREAAPMAPETCQLRRFSICEVEDDKIGNAVEVVDDKIIRPRSKRLRIAPLQWWKGERIEYESIDGTAGNNRARAVYRLEIEREAMVKRKAEGKEKKQNGQLAIEGPRPTSRAQKVSGKEKRKSSVASQAAVAVRKPPDQLDEPAQSENGVTKIARFVEEHLAKEWETVLNSAPKKGTALKGSDGQPALTRGTKCAWTAVDSGPYSYKVRLLYQDVSVTTCEINLGPRSQKGPDHTHTCEMHLMLLSGEAIWVETAVNEEKRRWSLVLGDMLFVPEGATYDMGNESKSKAALIQATILYEPQVAK